MKLLTVEDVLTIHGALVDQFRRQPDPISPEGLRSVDLLASAVARQESAFGGYTKYAKTDEIAATLLYGLVCNHPFHNGNKRTGLVAMLVFLDKNDAALETTSRDLYNLITDVASHTICEGRRAGADDEVEAIRRRVRRALRAQRGGERIITYRRLRSILGTHGYRLENPDGNHINIVGPRQTRTMFGRQKITEGLIKVIPYPSESSEVPKRLIKEIRRELKLDRDHGYDTDAFYQYRTVVDEVIAKYQSTLRRLGREEEPIPETNRQKRKWRHLHRRST